MGKIKHIKAKLIIGFLAVALLIGLGVWLARGCGGPHPAAPALGSAPAGAPPGWVAPPIETTPLVENPLKKSTAGKKTAALPAGSTLVEIKPHGAETVQVAILPDGRVIVPDGVDAVVYKKRPALVALEARPWVGGGAEGHAAGLAPAAAAGLDVVRVWRFHGGPGVVVSPRNVAALLAGAYNPWRNVDARVAAGYGTAGYTAFAGVDIGIVKPARR